MDLIISKYFPERLRRLNTPLLLLKWTCFVVGCMAEFVAGWHLVFNVYQNDLKETFNFTKKEVELQASLNGAGFGLAIIPGVIFDRFRPLWTSVLSILLSVTSWLLLWDASNRSSFYTNNSWLSAVFFFVSGLGTVFIYMVALNTNIRNFPKEQRVKITGFLDAAYGAGQRATSILYYKVLSTGDSSQSFGLLMLLSSIASGVLGFFCIMFLRLLDPYHMSDADGTERDDKNSYFELYGEIIEPESEELDLEKKEHISVFRLFLNGYYWLVLGICGFASTVGAVYMNNLTVITKSNGMTSHDVVLVLIIPITSLIASFGTGFVSDALKYKRSKEGLLVLSCVCCFLCAALSMIFGSNYPVLCLATVLCGIGVGMLWPLCTVVVGELFYEGDLGRNWGIVMSSNSFLQWVVQEIFGRLYDNETPSGEIFCTTGMHCVRLGLFAVLIAGVIAVICSILLLIKGS